MILNLLIGDLVKIKDDSIQRSLKYRGVPNIFQITDIICNKKTYNDQFIEQEIFVENQYTDDPIIKIYKFDDREN